MSKHNKEIKKINQLEFQKCFTHQNTPMSQTCVEEGCFFQFQPLCVRCQYDKDYSCQKHTIKPIHSVLFDLENLTKQYMQTDSLNSNSSCILDEISLLAQQFKNIADKCTEISENILMSSNKYQKKINSLAPEIKQIQHIVENIYEDTTTQNLRTNLNQLKKYVTVGEEDKFQFSFRNKEKLERVSIRYTNYFQKLEQLYSYIINDLNTAHQYSVFYTGAEFAEKQHVNNNYFIIEKQ